MKNIIFEITRLLQWFFSNLVNFASFLYCVFQQSSGFMSTYSILTSFYVLMPNQECC